MLLISFFEENYKIFKKEFNKTNNTRPCPYFRNEADTNIIKMIWNETTNKRLDLTIKKKNKILK